MQALSIFRPQAQRAPVVVLTTEVTESRADGWYTLTVAVRAGEYHENLSGCARRALVTAAGAKAASYVAAELAALRA